jgi:hypothetical protein
MLMPTPKQSQLRFRTAQRDEFRACVDGDLLLVGFCRRDSLNQGAVPVDEVLQRTGRYFDSQGALDMRTTPRPVRLTPQETQRV